MRIPTYATYYMWRMMTTQKRMCDLQCDAIDVCMHVCMRGMEGKKGRRKKCDTLYHTALYKKCAVVTIDLCVCMSLAGLRWVNEWMRTYCAQGDE